MGDGQTILLSILAASVALNAVLKLWTIKLDRELERLNRRLSVLDRETPDG